MAAQSTGKEGAGCLRPAQVQLGLGSKGQEEGLEHPRRRRLPPGHGVVQLGGPDRGVIDG